MTFPCPGFEEPQVVCATPLGLENSQIPDSAIVASSKYNQNYGPERARLRKVTQGSLIGGWSPKSSNQGEWIQFDLGKNTKVTRIATQGRDNANWWTTSYSLSYRVDGGSYQPYGQVGRIRFLMKCAHCGLLYLLERACIETEVIKKSVLPVIKSLHF